MCKNTKISRTNNYFFKVNNMTYHYVRDNSQIFQDQTPIK